MEEPVVGFDLEIATDIPEGTADWRALGPLGITVAALSHYPRMDCTYAILAGDALKVEPRMPVEQCRQLVRHLQELAYSGRTLVTWNGLGFDFEVLARESGMVAECADLAAGHVDMMFHAFCLLGYPVAMDKAAGAMGTQRKTEGMHGDMAPGLWRAGRHDEVAMYCRQDTIVTVALYYKVAELGRLEWITRQGARRTLPLPGGWLTVQEAMQLPEPDQSWMTAPLPRSRFTGWMYEGAK